MTARRLLIVMLILLGISTLAAALVPQRTLRGGTTTTTTATQPAQTAPAPFPAGGRSLMAKIVVGGKKVPVVAGPVCAKQKPRCDPIHVGDQVTLLVYSRYGTQLEIPEFGLVAFATQEAPARFELLPDSPEPIGVLFSQSRKVAARIRVLPAGAKAKAKQPAKSGARGGSGRS